MKYFFIFNGFPKEMMLDNDTKFTSNLYKNIFVDLGTQLNFSMSYHPQTYGQTSRVE